MTHPLFSSDLSSSLPLAGNIPFLGENGLPEEEEQITKIEDLADGSSVYEIGSLAEAMEDRSSPFYENLAEKLSERTLHKIANDLLEGISQDKDSRTVWEQNYLKGLKYLGFKPEDFKQLPFASACSAFDTTLSSALLRFYATARAELFPSRGLVDFEIVGKSSQALDDQGIRVKEWMNYYLTTVDQEYYSDSERLLMWLGLVGCAFRKVYQDPLLNRPVARFINPQDFIVNNDCVTILSSDRLTHVLHLTQREIKFRQMKGYWRDDAPLREDDSGEEDETSKAVEEMEGINTETYDKKSLHDIYEVHAHLVLDELDYFEKGSEKISLSLPYIVVIEPQHRKILAIHRNWSEDDPDYRRQESFVQYNYLPGFGIYGLGLAHILGANSIVLTSLLRQLVDAGTLKNFPGGLKMKGLRVETNDKAIGPSEFWDVETGGLPLRDAIMPMPYPEPSVVLKELRNEIIQQTQSLASTAETQVAENRADAPVGTTLALLEVSNKVQSSIFRSLHLSLSYELRLLFDLFGRHLPDKPYPFSVPGNEATIMRKDFKGRVRIIPVSDPSLGTSTQRIVKAESLLRLVQSAPQIHDLRTAYERMYEAMHVEGIDKILPLPKEAIPLDPVTENMNALQQMPLKAALWQDHEAHIITHRPLAQDNPGIMAHIQEHQAFKYYLEMQQQMEMEMPSLAELQNPEIQNQIALRASHVAQQQLQAQQQQQQGNQIDPNQVMLADIAQRKEAAMLKDKESKLKAETEAFKAQLKFESEKNKIEAEREMAEEKNQTELTIQQLKNQEKEKNDHGTFYESDE